MAFIGIIRPSIVAVTGIANRSGASGVPILDSDIVPSKDQSAYRITVVPSGTGALQLAMTIDDGSGPYQALLNGGDALNPGTSYLFTHGVTNLESYNFVLLGAPVGWRKLQIEEVTEGVI